jgi:hypothetical protein
LRQEEEGVEVHLLGMSTRREVYWNDGETSAMVAVVLGSLQRRRKQRGEGMLAAVRGGEKRGLGFAGRFKGRRCAALVEEEDSRARHGCGRAGDVSRRAHALSVRWKTPERELGQAGIKKKGGGHAGPKRDGLDVASFFYFLSHLLFVLLN